MSFTMIQRRAIGALLAASIISPIPTAAESTSSPPNTSTFKSSQSSNASKILSDANQLPDDQLRRPSSVTTISSANEEARARALLDRYYAISAEAQAASQPRDSKNSKATTPSIETVPVPSRKRTPASQLFKPLDTATLSKPFHKRYVICGGGTAAWAAIEAIMKKYPGAANDIVLLTDEHYFPYNRTMLSKELWHQQTGPTSSPSNSNNRGSVEYAYRHIPAQANISVVTGNRVVSLNPDEKTVELSNGTVINYDKVLLATGGSPKSPAFVSKALTLPGVREHVSVFRTLDDFERVYKAAESGKGVLVIGGGFLGTELAIALAGKSQDVSLVVAEVGVLYRVLPRYLSEFLARKIEDLGVKVVCGAVVANATLDSKKEELSNSKSDQRSDAGGKVAVSSSDSSDSKNDSDMVSLSLIGSETTQNLSVGHVVVAAGIEPEIKFAKEAGLEIDAVRGGVMVNDFMMAEPDVFVAGDLASFHDRLLGRRRVEHWDHSVVTGRIAGANMCGARDRYGLQSMFWSDLTNIGVEITAVGLVDSKLETFGVWNTSMPVIEDAPAMNELLSGAVFYLKDMEIVGVVLWNSKKGSGSLRRARALVDAKLSTREFDYRSMGDLVNLPDGSFRMYVRTKAS